MKNLRGLITLTAAVFAFGTAKLEARSPHVDIAPLHTPTGVARYVDSVVKSKLPPGTELHDLDQAGVDNLVKGMSASDAQNVRAQHAIRRLAAQQLLKAQMAERVSSGATGTVVKSPQHKKGSGAMDDYLGTTQRPAPSAAAAVDVTLSDVAPYLATLDARLQSLKPANSAEAVKAADVWSIFQAKAEAAKQGANMKSSDFVNALLGFIDESVAGEGKALTKKQVEDLASEVFGDPANVLGANEIRSLTMYKDKAYAASKQFLDGLEKDPKGVLAKIAVFNADGSIKSGELKALSDSVLGPNSKYDAESKAAFQAQLKRYKGAMDVYTANPSKANLDQVRNVAEGLLYSKQLDAEGKFKEAELCFHCPC